MYTGKQYAKLAEDPKYNSLKYSQVDCQAFVEKVLKDLGVRKSNGAVYDWRGSNDMWRNALSWKGTIAEARKKFGTVPEGSWCFMVAHDGGEVPRGYHDDQGNASHVGIVVNDKTARDSTKGASRDGVAYRKLSDFTHIGLPKMLDFDYTNPNIIEVEAAQVTKISELLKEIQSIIGGWKT